MMQKRLELEAMRACLANMKAADITLKSEMGSLNSFNSQIFCPPAAVSQPQVAQATLPTKVYDYPYDCSVMAAEEPEIKAARL